ncbi:hypothetical protein BJ875DRAFT_458272 [Amylocarpus encephaloides]|uniref:Zn(2)-C6 fungal-type domain-containing protein n=1 Tax=Amylocarpus encephaloides TaxID=45428 RepID=A0A9P7YL28_9HELO|nr:hypothetical protein BJ875DRAFT_458272 [Amylocarpus encephaloides]
MSQPEGTANTPRVRTRQGCWTCRRRRRKCDEDKPNCQNCIVKGFKCKYGVQLTFHDANLIQLDPEEAHALKVRTPARYGKLQFVDGLQDPSEESEQYTEAPGEDSRELAPMTPSPTHERTPSNTTNLDQIDYDYNETCHNTTSDELKTFERHPQRLERTNNPVNLPVFRRSPLVPPEVDQLRYNDTIFDANANKPELVKYFIDHIAPWLDLSSHNATYAVHLPVLSTTVVQLRSAMCVMAACQKRAIENRTSFNVGNALDVGVHYTPEASMRQPPSEHLEAGNYYSQEEVVATRHLREITNMLPLPMNEWTEHLRRAITDYEEQGMNGTSNGIVGAACWLMLRFDLASSIASRQRTAASVDMWHHLSTFSSSTTSQGQSTRHLHASLILCAQTSNLFSQSANGRANVDTWSHLYTRLQALQTHQSTDNLGPLLAFTIGRITLSPSSPSKIPTNFPLSIHTSRQTFYAHFLTHLTSLLLIQSRPRKINTRAAKGLKTAAWHAVQLCGLSISNNMAWSWEPVVMAALVFSGPFLSYGGQHGELAGHLRGLDRMTGWQVEREVERLERFWRCSY